MRYLVNHVSLCLLLWSLAACLQAASDVGVPVTAHQMTLIWGGATCNGNKGASTTVCDKSVEECGNVACTISINDYSSGNPGLYKQVRHDCGIVQCGRMIIECSPGQQNDPLGATSC